MNQICEVNYMRHLIGIEGLDASSERMSFFAEDAVRGDSIRPERKAQYPNSQSHFLNPILPSLRLLRSRRLRDRVDCLVLSVPPQGWSDDKFAAPRDKAENLLLLAMSALCRVGLFAQDNGMWRRTWFADGVIRGRYIVNLDGFLRGEWLFRMWQDYESALSWAWNAFETPDARELLGLFINASGGFEHSKIPQVSRGREARNVSLQVLAGAVAVGGITFSGFRWLPTLYGLWLVNDPKSPLACSDQT